jgi:hypothetical protein
MSSRLDRAIEQFEDETLDISMGERISGLRNALMWDAYRKLKAIGKAKKMGEKIEEDADHIDRMKYFKDIEKMYISELKMNKITGKSNDNMDKEFLKRIKEEKGSIGDIVRDLNPANKKDSEAA